MWFAMIQSVPLCLVFLLPTYVASPLRATGIWGLRERLTHDRILRNESPMSLLFCILHSPNCFNGQIMEAT